MFQPGVTVLELWRQAAVSGNQFVQRRGRRTFGTLNPDSEKTT
jgi:hypothetical protein